MHIAQGVMKCINVNRLTKAGCHFKFWVADWFAQLNNKMGACRGRGRDAEGDLCRGGTAAQDDVL